MSCLFASKMNTNNFYLIVYCVVTVYTIRYRYYHTVLVFGIHNFWLNKSVSFQFPCRVAVSTVHELSYFLPTDLHILWGSYRNIFLVLGKRFFPPLALFYFSAVLWGNGPVKYTGMSITGTPFHNKCLFFRMHTSSWISSSTTSTKSS